MEEKVVKKDWFRFFSPAILGIVVSIIFIIVSYLQFNESGGWSMLGVIMFLPVFGILVMIDFIIKSILKDRTLIIWVVELLAMGLIYFFWVSKFI